MAECTCPDDAWGGFCKHAVATLLVLADEVTAEPEVLNTWRSGDPIPDLAPRQQLTAPAPDVLADLLKAPAPLPEPVPIPPRLPVPMATGRYDDDVAAVLADALSVLRSR